MTERHYLIGIRVLAVLLTTVLLLNLPGVPLRELAEIRMIDVQGRGHWRLRQADGQILLIPVSAAGADLLYDAFAALPGIDMGVLSRAVDARAGTQVLWRRPAHAALT